MKTALLAVLAAASLAASGTAAVMAHGAKQEAQRTQCSLAAMMIPDTRSAAGEDSLAARKAAAVKAC